MTEPFRFLGGGLLAIGVISGYIVFDLGNLCTAGPFTMMWLYLAQMTAALGFSLAGITFIYVFTEPEKEKDTTKVEKDDTIK